MFMGKLLKNYDLQTSELEKKFKRHKLNWKSEKYLIYNKKS